MCAEARALAEHETGVSSDQASYCALLSGKILRGARGAPGAAASRSSRSDSRLTQTNRQVEFYSIWITKLSLETDATVSAYSTGAQAVLVNKTHIHGQSVDCFCPDRIPVLEGGQNPTVEVRSGFGRDDSEMTVQQDILRCSRHVGARFQFRAMFADTDAFDTASTRVGEADRTVAREEREGRVDDVRTTIAALLGCWPEPSLAVAARIGVKKAELDAYLAGQRAITDGALTRLARITGFDPMHGACSGDANHSVTTGISYVLFGSNTPERVTAAYDVLIGEDPTAVSVEVVPDGHAAAQRWRYLLILRESRPPSLMCLARTGRSARMLDTGQLARYRGELAVAAGFYDAFETLRIWVEQRPTCVLSAMGRFCEAWAQDIDRVRARAKRIGR